MPKLSCEKSPLKPVEQSTQDKTEWTNIDGINKAMMYCDKWGDIQLKKHLQSIIDNFSLVMMATR